MKLNREYVRLHTQYEGFYWRFNMGEHTVEEALLRADEALQGFHTNTLYAEAVEQALTTASVNQTERLHYWQRFFKVNSSSEAASKILRQIVKLEQKINTKLATRREGYLDPATKKFVAASRLQMTMIRSTNADEQLRKACFEALEALPEVVLTDYAKLVHLRNAYAHTLGYEDFYAYKLDTQEQLTKAEVFGLFAQVHEGTKNVFENIKKLEEDIPRLRKPWNQLYHLSASGTQALEKYLPFEHAVPNWLDSFGRLGIGFAGGTLTLDLVERSGKLANGFCHWPTPVHYKNDKRQPEAANFTSNITPGQSGASLEAYKTLFHEGGHAAHYLNNNSSEVCMNIEHAPASAAWAETQSMFIDTMMQGGEWLLTYGKGRGGEQLQLEEYASILEQAPIHTSLFMNKISATAEFEKCVYELKVATPKKIKHLARAMTKKYYNFSTPSHFLLNTPHLYRFEWSGSYHGYGLAALAVAQWREYFHQKYGYIVDNKQIGKEMKAVWQLGSQKSFAQFVKMATRKKLTAQAYIKAATQPPKATISAAKKRLAKQPKQGKVVTAVAADIKLVHGPTTIATNKQGNEAMCKRYAHWYQTLLKSPK